MCQPNATKVVKTTQCLGKSFLIRSITKLNEQGRRCCRFSVFVQVQVCVYVYTIIHADRGMLFFYDGEDDDSCVLCSVYVVRFMSGRSGLMK